MEDSMLKLAMVALPLILAASALSAAPLEMRVWQFQDYNMDHIQRLVNMAAEQKINRIQLSHNIVMDAEDAFSNPQLVKDINTICGWAHSRGIAVDIWTHELNGVPAELLIDKKVDLDNPQIWEFVKNKYDRLFKLCPDIDGIVLTMHETGIKIFQDGEVSSSIPPDERVAKLIDNMGVVCKAFGKKFFARTFSYEPDQLKAIIGGLKKSKADVTAMTKCVPHDWQPYYPNNPAIGDVGNKPQVVEFDLGDEFTGLSTIPYIELDKLKSRLDYDISKNISGCVLRVERMKWRAVDSPNQANIDVFTQMLSNPSADPHALYNSWLEKRYPKEAVPYLQSAFTRTFDIVNKGYFVLGYWITRHSILPDYDYAWSSLRGRSSAKWDPATKPIEQELYNPTPETLKKIHAEKMTALGLVNKSIDDIEKAKPYLKAEDYTSLSGLFQREKAMVKVWTEATNIIIGVKVYESAKTEASKQFLLTAADSLERLTAGNKDHLIKMAADYDSPDRSDNVDAAKGLVELARKTVK